MRDPCGKGGDGLVEGGYQMDGGHEAAIIKTVQSHFVEETMRFAWAPAHDVSFRDLKERRFVVQANCRG